MAAWSPPVCRETTPVVVMPTEPRYWPSLSRRRGSGRSARAPADRQGPESDEGAGAEVAGGPLHGAAERHHVARGLVHGGRVGAVHRLQRRGERERDGRRLRQRPPGERVSSVVDLHDRHVGAAGDSVDLRLDLESSARVQESRSRAGVVTLGDDRPNPPPLIDNGGPREWLPRRAGYLPERDVLLAARSVERGVDGDQPTRAERRPVPVQFLHVQRWVIDGGDGPRLRPRQRRGGVQAMRVGDVEGVAVYPHLPWRDSADVGGVVAGQRTRLHPGQHVVLDDAIVAGVHRRPLGLGHAVLADRRV
jgi:hypothetical protein